MLGHVADPYPLMSLLMDQLISTLKVAMFRVMDDTSSSNVLSNAKVVERVKKRAETVEKLIGHLTYSNFVGETPSELGSSGASIGTTTPREHATPESSQDSWDQELSAHRAENIFVGKQRSILATPFRRGVSNLIIGLKESSAVVQEDSIIQINKVLGASHVIF